MVDMITEAMSNILEPLNIVDIDPNLLRSINTYLIHRGEKKFNNFTTEKTPNTNLEDQYDIGWEHLVEGKV